MLHCVTLPSTTTYMLRHYCTSASRAMKTWAKGVYMAQEIAVNIRVRFYGSESQFAIHDDPGATSLYTIRDPKIVTSLHQNK